MIFRIRNNDRVADIRLDKDMSLTELYFAIYFAKKQLDKINVRHLVN